MPFAASCCDGSGRSQSSGTRASSYGRPSRVVAIVNRTIALCLEHCNTFAAQPAPPNSLHAYCGQRALATRTGRPVAFSAVIGRASMGAANGLGGLDVADIRTCGCRVPGVDLGGRLSAQAWRSAALRSESRIECISGEPSSSANRGVDGLSVTVRARLAQLDVSNGVTRVTL